MTPPAIAEQRILVVDDEAPIREMIRLVLERDGFSVQEAADARAAHALIFEQAPHLVLLDWMLPGMSGPDLARRLKKEALTSEIPIIMLTARSEESDKVRGLEIGADDYITKPFSPRELIARIRAVLRRSPLGNSTEQLCAGEMCLHPSEHRLTLGGQEVRIGPTEFRLLHFFMTHPERVYTRSQVLDQVWGGNVYIEERTVDVHIRRLRKILADHQHEHLVQTVRGVGYRFSQRS